MYAYRDGAWQPTQLLRPDDAVPAASFGYSLAFTQGVLWVGAPGDGRSPSGIGGAFYRFERGLTLE